MFLDAIATALGFSADAATGGVPGPADDYWYRPVGAGSATGISVTPETALRSATFLRACFLFSETFASLPHGIYRRINDQGDCELASDHPLADVLDSPNDYQTDVEFFGMMQLHLELRANAYARIYPGPRGAVDQLIPLHPDRVKPRMANGKLVYDYQPSGAPRETLLASEVFHMRGLSLDGISGVAPIALCPDPVAMDLAAQNYGATFFANDARPGGVLEVAGVLADEVRKRMRESWQKAQSGKHRHATAVLESGTKYSQMGNTNKESQFLEARGFQSEEIGRLTGGQQHMLGNLAHATFSNIEQQEIEFVTFGMLPRVKRWEARSDRDLIVPLPGRGNEKYFVKWNLDGLLRGDFVTRMTGYNIARNGGWMNVNEIRRKENMNGIGSKGDTYLEPLNMKELGAPAPPGTSNTPTLPGAPVPTIPPKRKLPPRDSRLTSIAVAAVSRIIRKEESARKRYSDQAAWASVFYADHDHASFVSKTLYVPIEDAEQYCAARIIDSGCDQASLEDWSQAGGNRLLALALTGEFHVEQEEDQTL